jgi:hypothetical protein
MPSSYHVVSQERKPYFPNRTKTIIFLKTRHKGKYSMKIPITRCILFLTQELNHARRCPRTVCRLIIYVVETIVDVRRAHRTCHPASRLARFHRSYLRNELHRGRGIVKAVRPASIHESLANMPYGSSSHRPSAQRSTQSTVVPRCMIRSDSSLRVRRIF